MQEEDATRDEKQSGPGFKIPARSIIVRPRRETAHTAQ
jgi:hypothetical protein